MSSTFWKIACLYLLIGALAGCHPTHMSNTNGSQAQQPLSSVWSDYAPRQLQLMRWTEITCQDSDTSSLKIVIYASLLDAYGNQIKAPGTFRFELCERTRRSARILGKRHQRWTDIQLINPRENQNHWQDYLRAYEFELNIDNPLLVKDYVLQATFFLPNQNRLTAEYPLSCP